MVYDEKDKVKEDKLDNLLNTKKEQLIVWNVIPIG